MLCTSLYMYMHDVHIITIIMHVPVSDRVFEGSGSSCTGMWSLDRALEVSGRMASLVGVVSTIQFHNIYVYTCMLKAAVIIIRI